MMIRLAIALCLSLTLHGTVWAGLLDKLTGRMSYPVTDSGYWVRHPTDVYWLDNDRIIFVGARNDERDTHIAAINSDKPHVEKVYIWDTRGNATSPYAPISRYGGVCFSRGYINFVTEATENEIVWREGTFGHEVEKRAPRNHFFQDKVKERRMRTSKLNCREYPMDSYPSNTDVALLEGHGYLGWRLGPDRTWDAEKEAPVRYYKDGVSPPVELSLKRKDIREPVSGPVYAEWANVYLLLGGTEWGTINRNGQLPKDHPFPIYLLTPGNGALQTINTHYQKGVGNWKYQYTRAGLLVFSSEITGTGIGDAGIYRVDGKSYQKILAGIPVLDALSPDGCRLAVGLQMRDSKGKHSPIQLKLIDLCQGGK